MNSFPPSLYVSTKPGQLHFFPTLVLASESGERIESLEIHVACGRFRSVAVIPDDWSLTIAGPASERTSLIATAGHGSTALPDMRDLDGAVTVSVDEPACFDISAIVITATQDEQHRHEYGRSQLVLKP